MNSSRLHPTLFSSSLEKPQDHILRLIKTLSPHAKVVPGDKLSTLDFVRANTKQCYLLEEGHVIINRRDDGITLNTESAPFVFGFTLNSNLHPRLCIRPRPTPCFADSHWKVPFILLKKSHSGNHWPNCSFSSQRAFLGTARGCHNQGCMKRFARF